MVYAGFSLILLEISLILLGSSWMENRKELSSWNKNGAGEEWLKLNGCDDHLH